MDRILEPVVAAVVPETCDLYGHIITGGKPYIGGEDQSRSIAVVAGLHVHIGPGPVGIFAGDRILLSGLFAGHGDLDPGLVAGAQRILGGIEADAPGAGEILHRHVQGRPQHQFRHILVSVVRAVKAVHGRIGARMAEAGGLHTRIQAPSSVADPVNIGGIPVVDPAIGDGGGEIAVALAQVGG